MTIKERFAALLTYSRARVFERSTLMFWAGSMGSVLGAPFPVNVFVGLALFAAGMIPDGTILPKKPGA